MLKIILTMFFAKAKVKRYYKSVSKVFACH